MTTFRISPSARDDLDRSWDYIAANNASAATNWLAQLYKKFLLLSRTPLLGEACPQLGGELRRFTAGNYLILYRVRDSEIEIVRVIHGARNIESLLSDS